MKSAFPEVEYIDKIHRNGKIFLHGEPPIVIPRALFDTGALSANYISQELVDRHRDSLGHCIRKVRGHVCLGDNKRQSSRGFRDAGDYCSVCWTRRDIALR